MLPEVATGFPKVSPDGKRQTIRLKRTYRFHTGARITAANFVAAFNRDANPKLYKAFLAAQKEAIDAINRDKRKAAQDYLDIAQDRKNTVDDIFAVINDKDYAFTLSPEKVFKTAVFMGKVGTVKDPPAKWQDLFFPDIHDLPGD